MIRVTIELIKARTHQMSIIGVMYLGNIGGTEHLGDYRVAVCRRNTAEVPRDLFDEPAKVAPNAPPAVRVGEVREYPRLAANVWRLITRACLAAFPEEQVKRFAPDRAKPLLSAQVMRGLRLVMDAAAIRERQDHWTTEQVWDVAAAKEWLDAGLLEGG